MDEECSLVERPLRVAAIGGSRAWLEPEPGGGCGGCGAMAMCGKGKPVGRGAAGQLEIAAPPGMRVGDRAVVGIAESSLLRAAAVAYAVPLAVMLGAGIAASLLGGGDGEAAAASVTGLACGLLLARHWAGRMSSRGELTPVLLRWDGDQAQANWRGRQDA